MFSALLQAFAPLQANPVVRPPFTLSDGVTLFWHTIRHFARYSFERLPYLLVGTVVFAVFWLLGRLIRRLLGDLATRSDRVDPMLADLVGRLASTGVLIFGFLAACVVIFPSFKPGDIIAGLGITTVAVGFAFKDILQNFFAGVLILWRRPFHLGDQIKMKDFEGTVEAINMRSTRLRTYSGERIIIPNGEVYTGIVQVRTAFADRRVQFEISIAPDSSIEAARTALVQALAALREVNDSPAPEVLVTQFDESAVLLRVLLWCPSRQAQVNEALNQALEAARQALQEAGIRLASVHTVLHVLPEKTNPRVA